MQLNRGPLFPKPLNNQVSRQLLLRIIFHYTLPIYFTTVYSALLISTHTVHYCCGVCCFTLGCPARAATINQMLLLLLFYRHSRGQIVNIFKNWKWLFENIYKNVCKSKNAWKYIKYCLKTENCCLKSYTKYSLSSFCCITLLYFVFIELYWKYHLNNKILDIN